MIGSLRMSAHNKLWLYSITGGSDEYFLTPNSKTNGAQNDQSLKFQAYPTAVTSQCSLTLQCGE